MMRAWKRIWQRRIELSNDVMSQTEGYEVTAGRSGTDHSIVKRAKKLS
jgi:hypothetical protein